jgi:hypothetical protein
MVLRQITLVILCFSVSLCASAQQGLAEQKLVLAQEVIALTRATDAFKRIVPTMMENQRNAIASMAGERGLTEEQNAEVEEILAEFMETVSSSMPPLLDQMAVIYAQQFTIEDLMAVRKFYQSAAGQRFVEGGLAITPRMVQVSQAWTVEHILPSVKSLGDRLRLVIKNEAGYH